MALPDLSIARVARWCAARLPKDARHQVRVECQIGRTDPDGSGDMAATPTGKRKDLNRPT